MSRILVVGDVADDVSVRALAPVAPASDTTAEIRRRPGGSAANVAAWLGHLGGSVSFVGRVGAEAVRRHTEALAAHGVDARLSGDPGRETATVLLHLDEAGERTMFVDRGANAGLGRDEVPEELWERTGWLHLTGYSFFDPATRPVARALMAEAGRRGVEVSVDPSTASFLADCGGATFLDWIDGAAVVLPNLDEARVLVDARGPHIDFAMLTERVPHVVVTLGSGGAAYAGREHREQVTAHRVDVVDTTGAGDALDRKSVV